MGHRGWLREGRPHSFQPDFLHRTHCQPVAKVGNVATGGAVCVVVVGVDGPTGVESLSKIETTRTAVVAGAAGWGETGPSISTFPPDSPYSQLLEFSQRLSREGNS